MRPLDESFRSVLVAVAKARGMPSLDDGAKLAAMLSELSAAYNLGDAARARDFLAARLAFSLPRDIPKAEGAVRELVATGALAVKDDAPLRVLDVGAGMGAMTMGIARALAEARRAPFRMEATWVDSDDAAMSVGRDVLSRAPFVHAAIDVKTRRGDASSANDAHNAGSAHGAKHAKAKDAQKQGYDVIACGQVISELDLALEPNARVAKHAAWLVGLSQSLADDGSLVVVEPALANRTRHLHAVRDAVLASSSLSVFAPCLHRAPCPALATPGDWCHEDLPIDLPGFITPLARAAGLRWQGLTFSYLVLRRDGKTLRDATQRASRMTSGLLASKGKVELYLCGALEGGITRAKVQRLDRDENEANALVSDARRGDLFSLDPAPKPRGRVGPEMRVLRTRFS